MSDYDMKKDSEEKGKMAVKILDALVFDKLSIDYEVRTEVSRYGTKPFYFTFVVDVDVDKMYMESPKYDSTYSSVMYDLEDHIERALRYVNLQDYFGGVLYDYFNDSFLESEVNKMEDKLFPTIKQKYSLITKEEFEQSEIYFYPYKSESDYAFIRIDFVGLDIRDENDDVLVDCDTIFDIMYEIFLASPLSKSFDYENATCL